MESMKAHEDAHGGQPGKLLAKALHARTPYGDLPIGEMLVEGGNEFAMQEIGMTPPSRYFGDSAMYSFYRRFVEELEYSRPGVTKDFMRAAARCDLQEVANVLDSVPRIERLTSRYAAAWAARN